MFTNDEWSARKSALHKNLKTTERLLWIDYGVFVDEGSLRQVISKDWQWHGVVFPCVTEGIDWDKFKNNINTSEPVEQKGLNFDTQVTKRVQGDFYNIEKTNPKCFCIDTKHFLKNIKHIPNNFEDLFADLRNTKFRVVAYTAARLVVTYPHECLGNILGAAGVTANKG